MMRGYLGVIVACVLLGASCSDSSTGPSASVNITGSWNGTAVSQVNGTGAVRVTFTQTGNSIGGTWAATYASAASANDTGTLSGQLNGSTLQITLNPGNPAGCPYVVTATATNSSITGTYTTANCTISVGGNISLTK